MAIGDLNLSSIGRAYGKVEKRPLLEALLLGGGGALAGHYGGRFAAKAMMSNVPGLRNLSRQVSPQAREEAVRSIQGMTSMLGGSLGALYAITKHGDFTNIPAFGRSMIKGRPAALSAQHADQIRQSVTAPRYGHQEFDSGRTFKGASADVYNIQDFHQDFKNPFDHERVPIKHSVDLLNQDPFLTVGQKGFSTRVMEQAEMDGSGLTSGKKIARSAVRAGVGFGTAYMFGKTMGTVLGLPQSAKERLSRVGGLAAAVVNTGIFEGHRL